MTPTEKLGRGVVLVNVGLLLITSLTVIVLYVSQLGTNRLPAQSVRFLLTLALCYWLYRGSLWAKRVMLFLFGVAGSLAFLHAVTEESFPWTVGTGLGIVYESFVISMTKIPGVDTFLAYQRRNRSTSTE